LEAILERLVDKALKRARFSGAQTDVVAMAAVRATKEAEVNDGSEKLPVIVGTPLAGETLGNEVFDGSKSTALFPGDLPEDPALALGEDTKSGDLNFLRFKPPELQKTAEGMTLSLPHIRLDRGLEFLLGDYLV
jgi:predicted YcjX-like family ATPase